MTRSPFFTPSDFSAFAVRPTWSSNWPYVTWRSVPSSPTHMYATLFLRPDFTWRSRQLYVLLNLPPWNHSNVGYFQSKAFVHGLNHSSSFAASAQNASGSSTDRLYSAA